MATNNDPVKIWEGIRKIWEELRDEAHDCRMEHMPTTIIKTVPAPDGYVAEICLKRFQVYHRDFEVKGRACIRNSKTGEIQFETGQWVTEKGAIQGLQRAVTKFNELVAYRAAMATKNKPQRNVAPLI